MFGFSQSDTLQVKVKGKIMDIKTKMPIARVTVLNKNTSTVVLASENGDFEKASEIYKSITKSSPKNQHAWHMLGLIEFQKSNFLNLRFRSYFKSHHTTKNFSITAPLFL